MTADAPAPSHDEAQPTRVERPPAGLAGPPPDGPASSAALAHERGYLLRMARSRLRDGALAEDVVHDTLLAAWAARARFAGRSSLRTWLTAILQRRIADALRRERRAPAGGPAAAAAPETIDDGEPEAAEQTVDPRDPARLLEARQSVAQLQAELQQLPPLAAQVLVLRRVDGFSNDETARRLRLDPSQVPAILYRALQKLRRQPPAPTTVP